MKTKFVLATVLFTIGFQKSYAQDEVNLNLSTNNTSINPALAGSNNKGKLNLNLVNSSSWISSKTGNVNFYQHVPKSNGYIGMTYNRTSFKLNNNITSHASLFYSQNINIGNVLVRPSVQLGMITKSVDWPKTTYGDLIDPEDAYIFTPGDVPIEGNARGLNVSFGTMINYKKFTLGLSAHHLNQPNISLVKNYESILPIRYGVQAAYSFNFDKLNLDLTPFALYQNQNNFQEVLAGLDVLFNKHYNLSFGMNQRDALIFSLGYKHNSFSVNYSYQNTTTSKLNNNGINRGTHQLGLSFNFWKVKPAENFKQIDNIFNR